MNKIYIVGGGKGGVGKSTVSMALLDVLKNLESEKIFFIETDNENPDVFLAVKEDIPSQAISMKKDGWQVTFGEAIENNKDANIVVNMGARTTEDLIEHDSVINDVAKELNKEIVVLWCINAEKECLQSLIGFMDSGINASKIHAVKNTFFGDEDDFVLFDNSKIKKKLNETVVFPKLTSKIKNKLSIEDLPLWANVPDLSIVSKSSITQYRNAVKEALKVVI